MCFQYRAILYLYFFDLVMYFYLMQPVFKMFTLSTDFQTTAVDGGTGFVKGQMSLCAVDNRGDSTKSPVPT